VVHDVRVDQRQRLRPPARADKFDNAPVNLGRTDDRPGFVRFLWHVASPHLAGT
jgi:hypothetical protein